MSLSLILLALVGWTLGLLFTLSLMRMSRKQDCDALRHQERRASYSDVTMTNRGTV